MVRECNVCGSTFKAVTNKKYCSESCRRTRLREQQLDHYHRKVKPVRVKDRKETPCISCGKAVGYKTNRNVLCGTCRVVRIRRISKTSQNLRRRLKGKPLGRGKDAECDGCGRQFVKGNAQHRLCAECGYERSLSYAREKASEARQDPRFYIVAYGRIRKRRESDPIFDIKCRVRTLVSTYIYRRGHARSKRTKEILGIDSWQQLAIHLEKQFTEGMSWGNRKDWHVDHIVPISSANTEEDVIRLNHYTNLRPIWAKENMSKGASMEYLL